MCIKAKVLTVQAPDKANTLKLLSSVQSLQAMVYKILDFSGGTRLELRKVLTIWYTKLRWQYIRYKAICNMILASKILNPEGKHRLIDEIKTTIRDNPKILVV